MKKTLVRGLFISSLIFNSIGLSSAQETRCEGTHQLPGVIHGIHRFILESHNFDNEKFNRQYSKLNESANLTYSNFVGCGEETDELLNQILSSIDEIRLEWISFSEAKKRYKGSGLRAYPKLPFSMTPKIPTNAVRVLGIEAVKFGGFSDSF